MSNGAVLVVDDEAQIRRALSVSLGGHGFSVTLAEDGEAAIKAIGSGPFDVVVLDLVMPRIDGFGVLREIRSWSDVPVIVLSARGREADKVEALNLGADDYLTKPFGIEELLARMRAVLRRRPLGLTPVIALGDVTIDLDKHLVLRNGAAVHLTPTEFELMRVFAVNAGKVMTHRQLMEQIWGRQSRANAQQLRVHINAMRHKLETDPANPTLIATESGIGYRLVMPAF